MKNIDYVVAHKWEDTKPVVGNLATYTYHSEIQHGTLEDARKFLMYVRDHNPDEQWDIYKIKYEKLTVIDN